jgi:hypothetical protein
MPEASVICWKLRHRASLSDHPKAMAHLTPSGKSASDLLFVAALLR